MHSYLEIDNNVFLFISQALRFDALDSFFLIATDFKTWGVILAIFMVYAAIKEEKEMLPLFIVSAAIAIGLNELIVSGFLKDYIARERPCHVYKEQFEFVAGCTKSFSFPSSHAANAFGVAISLIFFYHKFWFPALIAAIIVGVSRVYLGVHYPSDVIAGAVIGTLLAFIVATLLDNAYKNYVDSKKEIKY
ncbi:MAG: phosphatase PAP2 family protein [Nitrospinae bacterium]|nr:phosphatase PAP2 family protein [Nitrospinota bacterium]